MCVKDGMTTTFAMRDDGAIGGWESFDRVELREGTTSSRKGEIERVRGKARRGLDISIVLQ